MQKISNLSGKIHDLHDLTTPETLHGQLNRYQNDYLLTLITEEEIRKNFKTCIKKSSGPDGLTYEFYLKNLLFNSLLNNPAAMPNSFAEEVIILIPKVRSPSNVSEFRPISLLNCDYKIFTKILANRMLKCLHLLIGDSQSACISGKSCIDNLLVLRNIIAKTSTSVRLKYFFVGLDLGFRKIPLMEFLFDLN
jgi:hypothetical protein